KWDLMVVDCDSGGKFVDKPRSLTSDFDSAVGEFIWSARTNSTTKILGGSFTTAIPPENEIVFIADKTAQSPYFIISLKDGKIRQGVQAPGSIGTIQGLTISRGLLAYTKAYLHAPPEVYWVSYQDPGENQFQSSQANTKLLAGLDMPKPESV